MRQRHALLFLLPVLAVASSTPDGASQVRLAKDKDASPALDPVTGSAVKPIHDVGTVDAPFDGKDGKPHSGPFVDPLKKGDKSETTTGSKKELPPLKDAPADHTVYEGKAVPDKNDGVMDDRDRLRPKKGTTGTEGGVSEKDKARKAKEGKTGERVENVPETPKEKPPLPQSEQEKITGEKAPSKESEKGTKADSYPANDDVVGLEKPADLPEKLRDSPNPVPHSANKDHLDLTKPKTTPKKDWKETVREEEEGIIQPFHSFVLSLTMILVSEVGDKTFLVAALMAMKHDRMLVFSAAFGALLVMTVLSAVLGHTVPALIPKSITNFLAAGLFFVFGAKLLREGLAMSPDEGVGAEMQEVEMELAEKEHQALKQGKRRSSVYDMELGLADNRKSRSQSRLPKPPRSPSTSPARSPSPRGGLAGNVASGLSNLASLLLSPAWVQTFVMTFLGEWGDRSQIATIAMAAGQDWWWVTLGAMLGHACCTGVAVVGGRAIAGKVSMRVVTIGGAVAFLVFGFIYLYEALFV